MAKIVAIAVLKGFLKLNLEPGNFQKKFCIKKYKYSEVYNCFNVASGKAKFLGMPDCHVTNPTKPVKIFEMQSIFIY